jgi:hypothetical protein
MLIPGNLPPAMARGLAGMLLCVFAVAAQNQSSSGTPPVPVRVTVPAGESPAAVTFGAVTPQYNFSYGADPNQPLLPTGGLWNFDMPVQVTPSTPGWTTGEFGLEGIPDAFYFEPYFTSGGVSQYAGGCSWSASYDEPPYWIYNGGEATGNKYEELTGPILRAQAAIGSVYQSASQQATGSEQPTYGFAALAEWNPNVYTTAPYVLGALYFASDSCYSGDIEYGFAHYNYYSPAVDQFYFYNFSNCSTAPGTANSYGCIESEDGQNFGVNQCSAAVNLPTLQPNSQGNDWYFWYAYISQNPSNGHYQFLAGVRDPYTNAAIWSCVGDPLGSPTFPVSTCPQTESASYACPNGQVTGAIYPIKQLFGGLGSVTAGMTNISNTPPTGRANPMLRMKQLYIAMP